MKNKIHHLLISGQWRSSVQDTRVQRGADNYSDHYLVRTTFKIHLQTHTSKNKVKPRFDVDLLKDEETKKKFCKSVRCKMEEHRMETEDTEEVWEQQRSAYVLGFRKGRSKPWISNSTWKLIDERKEMKIRIDSTRSERIKNRMKEEYKEKDIEVKRNVREDKRRWMAEKAQRAQAAAENGQQHSETTDRPQQQTSSCSEEQGWRPAEEHGSQEESWKEHFQEVLNRDAPEEPPQEEEEGEELNISTEPPMLEEIKTALKTLNNGKAPGPDQITAEMLRADPELTSIELKRIFDFIWEKETVPMQLSKILIHRIQVEVD